jgi:dTDP-4-dehydrorhamnose reductase
MGIEREIDRERIKRSPQILMIGGSGLVGSASGECFGQKNVGFESPRSSEVNILDLEEARRFVEESEASTVWLNAAFTDVNVAEKEAGDRDGYVWKSNVSAVENMAQACRASGKHLIYTSTGFVFAGNPDFPGPYNENSETALYENEVSWYGYTKLQGEQAIREVGCSHSIIRIDYPFGNPASDKDYMNKTLQLLKKGFPVFDDQFIAPTYIPDVAEAISVLSQRKIEGTFHVSTNEAVSPFEIARRLALHMNLDIEIIPGSFLDYQRKSGVRRPQFGGLKCDLTQQQLGIKFKTLDEAIIDMIEKQRA